MVVLDSSLRNVLEKAIILARDEAEKAGKVALDNLAVNRNEPFAGQTPEQRQLRNALRAKARQLGDGSLSDGLNLLVEEVAYEQWHRMLFARFLAENNLLMHPTGVPVTLQDCADLAVEEGESDQWQLAASYASRMLPGIFHNNSPSVQVRLTPEGRSGLQTILAELPLQVYTSEDGLGWVYQFWQSKRKKEVSQSGRKIERLDLAAYSQLFTEDYMVRFLLENSLGAWWASCHPGSPLIKNFTYLRFHDDGTPAAGAFPGWPGSVAEVTVMDPCCGSGHFLVAAFGMLSRMRMEEEGLAEAEAADAVLRDNVFGLELDPRCVQIAAFALALAAWKAGGYRSLPLPNVACSGIPVRGQLEDWSKIAKDDVNLKHTLEHLHLLFSNAPDLGSLTNPSNVPLPDRMFTPDFAKVASALDAALARERGEDPVAVVFGEGAKGVARAANLLTRQYTLVSTNVPYLARGKQGDILKDFIENQYPEARADLATAFLERCRAFTVQAGAYALVTPQNWLFLGSYRKLREKLLKQQTLHVVAKLGEGGFESSAAAGAFTTLLVIANSRPPAALEFSGLDLSAQRGARDKARLLCTLSLQSMPQVDQLQNPDARISLEPNLSGSLLAQFANSLQGTTTGDNPRFVRNFWELPLPMFRWEFFQSTVDETVQYGGREYVVDWQGGKGELSESPQARVQGMAAFGRMGISVRQMRHLPSSLYTGEMFDMNCAVLLPKERIHLDAIWAFCSSPEFNVAVRRIDSKMNVTNATLVKVPFDLEHWQNIAEERGSLPEPNSDDPTQWLFKGNPVGNTESLQVALARLLGYRWPQQNPDLLSMLADQDGILPLSPTAGEEPASERLRAILAAAYGKAWSSDIQDKLLQQVGFGGKGLDVWLREGFFEQHCKLFHQRPFIWHIWDGRRDGFSALVSYHKLDAARLEKLIYTYLGDWIRSQHAARDAGTAGADARLVAALELQKKLEAIRGGEPPFDIYVRWKTLEQQSIGWNPDLNDGVRLNVRPFVTAGVLRSRVNVKWGKDRGMNPDSSERFNDCHLTSAEKRAAKLGGRS